MPARHPQRVFDEARRLRCDGLANAEIAERLGVSPAWVSINCRDIELTAEQRAALDAYRKNVHAIGTAARAAGFRRQREAAQRHGRALARSAPTDFIAGCMLHWAEGSKARNALELTNADPVMLRYWVDWIETWLDAAREDIAVTVNVHLGNGLSLLQIAAYWARELDVPPACFRRSVVNRPSSASKHVRRPLVYGTVRISLHSTYAVQLVYGAIQEFAGFERPEWLDMGTVPTAA